MLALFAAACYNSDKAAVVPGNPAVRVPGSSGIIFRKLRQKGLT